MSPDFKRFLKVFSTGDPEKVITDLLIHATAKPLKRGARAGWVLALDLSYPAYRDIVAEAEGSPESIDHFFIEYYMHDFEGRIEQHLNNSKGALPYPLQTLIEEAVWAFKSGKNHICIPALFSALEGVLVDLSNKGDRRNTRYREGIDDAIQNDRLTMPVMALISISSFLDFAFSKSDFEQSEFDELNRHWSQHGRYLEVLSEKPVLQLFSALALALFMHRHNSEV